MKSPIFFSKRRTVRFWIQIVLFLALVRIAVVPSALYANPTGEQVVGGAAGFNRPDAATLIVNQNTDRAVINWNNFSIANGELTKFVQPSSSSAVLNRVVTANPSAIYGTLQANGNVYLINPGGVLVGAGGVVNTASFVASTQDINTDEFMKGGQLNFKGNSDASVINEGNITAREGDVFLIAKEVKNEGQLMAKDGTVGMVSGTEVSLQAVGQGNYKVRLMAAEKPMTESGGQKTEGSAEIVNEGVIQAANAVLEAKGSYLPMAIKNTGVIEATGLVENGDGSVTLTGGEGDILNTGVLAALQRSLDGQRETGGSIMLAGKNVTSNPGSIITAAGKDGGGVVKLRSEDTTILRGSIEVVGASESAKGGKVQLLGERVGLFESAKVDASGGAGGGEVLVGGDYLGKNPNVPNAKATVMGSEAKINADATANGDGGRVILWSDEYTGFYGNISARGGTFGGDGGFIETSSKVNLQAFGGVSIDSPGGKAGLWLLDPGNISVETASNGKATATSPFQPNAADATVANTTINTALLTGNVTILTADGPTAPATGINQTGTITINAPITSAASGFGLTLTANSSVIINNTITLSGGNLTISGTSVTQSSTLPSALIGNTLTVTAGTIQLAGAANQFSTVNLTSRNGEGVLDTVNTEYRDLNNYTVNISGLAGSGNVQLATDTGTVTIGSLNGSTGVQRLLLGTSNDTATSTYFAGTPTISIATLAAQTLGTIQFNEGGEGFVIGTVLGVDGVSAGNVRVSSDGSITQTQPLTVPGIFAASVTGSGSVIDLENEFNDVGSVLLQTSDGAVSFRDSSGLIVLGITAGGSGSNIGLRVDSGEVTSTPGSFGGLVGTGAITAVDDGLALLGGANYRLEILNAGIPLNNVRGIGIDMIGNNSIYLFRNLGELDIRSVNANGLSASGVLGGESGFVTLTAGGDITQSAVIDMQGAGTLGAPGSGGTLYARTRFNLFGSISTDNTADITLTDSGNQLGNILLETLNFAGDRAQYGLIQYGDADGFNIMGIRSAWNATLESGISDAGGPNTQSGAIVLGFKEPGRVPAVAFGGLLLLGERGYNLNDGGVASLGNDIDYLAADIPGYNTGDANRTLTYTDKNPFEIYWVDQFGDGTLASGEPLGIVSSGVLTLRARDGNPDLVNLDFPTQSGGQQGITISTYRPVGADWTPGIVQAHGPITITVEDGQSLRPVPVRNADGVFNMNFGTTLISRDTDNPDLSGITITADNMSLNGSIQALVGAGDILTQSVILQPFTGSVGDPLVANRNVVIGTKLGRPTSQLELLQNELRTVNADTLQIQTASRTTGSAAGGPYAINVVEDIGLIGTEAGGGVGTFRLRAFGDVNLGGRINSVANSTGVTAPLNVSLNAGDAATAGQVFAKAGITTLNGFIDLAGTDILIADNLDAGTGLVALRPTRFFGLTDLTGGLEDLLGLTTSGGGFNPNSALTVTIGAPSGAGGVQAVGKAVISTATGTYGQLAGVAIQDSGSGYLGGPATVTIGPVSATGVAGIESGSVASVLLTNGGSGYTSVPNVTFSASNQGGTQATGVAVIDQTVGSPTFGQVIQINITNAGTGYTQRPIVTVGVAVGAGDPTANPPGAGVYTANPATAYSNVGGSLAINLGTEPGLGTALGLLPSELSLITAQTIQVGAFALDTYPIIGGGSPVGHPFITGSISAPTFNTGRIVLSDNINVGSQDLVLVTTSQVQNRFQNGTVPSTLDQALAITAGGLGVISTGGYPNYPEATVQLYGPNQIDRVALIVPNGSVALRAVDGFVGGGNFGTSAVDPGAVGGVTYSSTQDYRGIGIVNVGELSITSGGSVTVRERAFSGGPASYVLQNAVGLLGADLSQAQQGDAFYFEAVGGGIVGDMRQGVVTSLLPVSSIPYEYQPVITIGAANDTGGLRGAASATLDPVSGAVTAVTLTSTGLGYTTTSAAAPSVNAVVSGIGLPVVDVTTGTVTDIKVAASGSGYSTVPTVTIIDPLGAGAGATATAVMKVARTQIFGGGSGYAIGDAVNFVGGAGAGATGSVTGIDANGAITGISITAGGGNYTSIPSVTVTSAGGGVGANVTASLGVASFTLGAPGALYTSVPTVALTGGGLTAASVTLGTNGGVNTISLGTGYTTLAGSVAITDGGAGSGAQAIATGGISRFALATPVDGYAAAPVVTITAPTALNGVTGRQAQASAIMGVDTIAVTTSGSGYSLSPSVVINGGGGTGATADVATFSLATASQIQILSAGSGYVTGDALNFVNGGGAVGSVTASGGVITGITLTTPGSGITALPAITVASATGTGAVLTPLLGVESITIANTGLGYTVLPSITITDANGAGAAAAVTDLAIFGVALANNLAGGAGYQTAPSTAGTTITIGANTLGATPTVTSTLSTLFTSTARGSGYTEPSVTYTANAGSTGVGGYVVSGFTGGVNGIVTSGGAVTLSFNDLEIQGLLPSETGYGTANSTQLTTVDTTSGGANNPANITIQPATGTETGGFSVVNGLPIKGSPIPINIGSTALPDANNGNINLSQGDLDTFIGQQLTIGRNSTVGFEAGPITVSAAVIMNPVNIPVMNLVSGGEISDLGTASGIARSNTLGVGVSFRLGLDAFGDIGLVGSGNNADVLAAQTANRASNVRYVDQTGITIGASGDIVGVLAKTFYLQAGAGLVSGDIGQESAGEIQASNLSLRVGTVGAGIANSRAVLNQQNEVSNFAADFNTAAGTTLYFENSTDLRISNISAGQPNNNPPAVQGVRATRVQIVNGGDLTQQDLAPMLVSGSLIISVTDGGNIILPSSLNNIPSDLVVGAVKADGTAGTVNDLTLRSIGGITVGNSGVFVLDLLTAGTGYTSTPTVAFSGAGGATATASMEVGVITVGTAGSAYVIAPTVSITPNALDTTGSGAAAVATIDENPLSATYGQVKEIVLTSTGANYTLAPSVTLSGGGGSGASASATLEIANLILTASGTTYLITPTVTISGGGATTQGTAQAAITTTAAGLTGDLTLVAGGAITQGLITKNAISVAGNTTLTETSGLGINLSNSENTLVGTVTISQGGGGNVALVNSSGLVLGNIGPVAATPVVPMGNLSLTSLSGSIYQNGTGTSLTVGGNSTFLAQTSTGTPNGAVILNNLGNSFTGSVAATGTRVIIRDSTALNLGAVTASTSLSATSTGNFTQSGAINVTGTGASAINATGAVTLSQNSSFGGDLSVTSTAAGPATTINQTGGVLTVTGNSTFTAAGGNSISVGQANTFTGTVSFAASSGTLANITVRDTTALDLQAMTLSGDLLATSGGAVTDNGALLIGGSTTISASGQNITLDNANQFTGAVTLTGANVTLNNTVTPLLLGTGSVSGNLAVTSTTAMTQSGATFLTVGGDASFSAINALLVAQNITLNNGNQFAGAVSLTGANVAVTDAAGLILGATTATGTLAATATTGNITQTGALNVTGASTFTGANGVSITLDQSANVLTGIVSFVASAGNLGNVTLVDTTAVDLQALTLSGNLSITSGGPVTDSGVLAIGGTTTVSATGQVITLDSANQFTGAVSLTGADVAVTDAAGLNLGATTVTGIFIGTATSGNITQSGAISVTGTSNFIAANGANITLGNSANTFTGAVTFASAGTLSDITLADTTAFQIQDGLNISGNLSLTAAGITQGIGVPNAITIGDTTTLNGGTGAIVLANSGNSYGGAVTVTGGASADMFFRLADEADLGAVTTSGAFTLRTAPTVSFNIANGASAGFDVTDPKLSNFNVGTFAPIATGGGDLDLGNLTSYPGIGGISLTTQGVGGDINAFGAINLNTLQFNSSGTATFSAVNQIQNLGDVTVAVGGVTLQNARGLNLAGTATMPGRLSLEVAGQFYNLTGQSQPLGGVAGGSVIKSLSLMGGLPNQVSGLAGFSYRYDGKMPTSGNVMSYAVSPLSMFAPGGTTIAGVDLGGTQTGGGQFNTFLTGSDNLNWMISDFGRFDMPTVKPSGMDYILYPQRVEPETKTLPAATLGQLERELGRPPTLDEIQAREVAVREAAMVRSGAILERSSFDAVEDEVDKQESAEVPVQVIDGGKPQAGGPSVAPNPLSGGAMEGLGVGPQARKTQSVRQGSNGPILRSGPIRSVAQLRPAEPSQSENISEASAQALKLDAKSVIEQERASAEVGIAPPIAAGR
jgi:filamentous hemagglutinin family protein